MKKILITAIAATMLFMTACEKETKAVEKTSETNYSDETVAEVTETAWEPTKDEQRVARFLKVYFNDPEEFPDKENYQYYSRAIGKDKDYLLNPEMWEVFYNAETINRNRDINGLDIYLVRLNPYKLLEVYAENNNCTVDELCKKLSVNKEQLYYNWGYNPASVDYMERHKDNKVSYSIAEQKIFGIYNDEERDIVMRTHLIVYDHNENTVTYQRDMFESHEIYRRDMLHNYSTEASLYSDFFSEEKEPAFKVNGIGIRAVIPLSLPNAIAAAIDKDMGDENVTVMINTSPFSYGCTDEDKLDLDAIYKYMDEHSN